MFAALIIFALLCVVFFANRWNVPEFGTVALENQNDSARAGQTLTVATWNIGYGALGERADFVVDGGKHVRVLTRDEITAAAAFIGDELNSFGADVLLVQETAGASFLTRGVNVRKLVVAKLSQYADCFWADFSTALVPPPLRVKHGMALFTKNTVTGCEILPLPQDPKYYYGFLKKYYAGIIARHPIKDSDKSWVVINIHLSAFDDGANVREQQIAALFEFAQREFAAGNYVVIGGDWNMKISPKEFPHTTDPEFLFWIYDFPSEQLPDGWQFVFDEDVPTVRTLHKKYDAGDNYTMIIDGFAVSPNVNTNSVSGVDYQFKYTDHQPVIAEFSTR